MPNRITVAPMCQYSAKDGVPQDWHLVHLGQFAMSGAGLIFTEATGVEPEGRITPGCTGLYDDATEAAFARIVAFMKSVGDSGRGHPAWPFGRKGNTVRAVGRRRDDRRRGGWQPQAPSAVPYLPDWPAPRSR